MTRGSACEFLICMPGFPQCFELIAPSAGPSVLHCVTLGAGLARVLSGPGHVWHNLHNNRLPIRMPFLTEPSRFQSFQEALLRAACEDPFSKVLAKEIEDGTVIQYTQRNFLVGIPVSKMSGTSSWECREATP